MSNEIENALRPGLMVDSDHPQVLAYAQAATRGAVDARERATSLYHAVRDDFRYDPYTIDLSDVGLRASTVLLLGHGWCVSKSALLAAACRAVGVPALVGYADVRNHLSTARLREAMGTDEFFWHGYTAIYLEGRWLKATPAFNIELCQKLGLSPLGFDGSGDSLLQASDQAGNTFMEYLRLRGEFHDVPNADIRRTFDTHYPRLARLDRSDFDRDIAAETRPA